VPQLETGGALMAAEGDHVGAALALIQLAEIRLYLADPGGAVELLRRAARLEPPSDAVRIRVAAVLGLALVELGRPGEARAEVAAVIDAAGRLDRQTERMCVDVLGRAALRAGDAATALVHAERATALNRASGQPIFEAAGLTDTAVAMRHLGRADEATDRHAEALRILHQAGEQHRTVRSLLPYAEACLATGDPDAAAPLFQAALDIATAHGVTYLVPAARAGLARVSRPVPGHPNGDRRP
jgi:tetratricopeptide (TPR) repeat protein